MVDALDDLADLWRWFADGILAGNCRIYDEIARSVVEDRELLALQRSARPHAHLPPMLLAGAHYLLLNGADHPLADVYAGRSTDPAPPLFRDLCLGHRRELLDVLNARTIQTNEVGRSALLGPALTWAAAGEPIQLVDVGCSAGLNMLCDRFRLNYGSHGSTGPEDSSVQVDCTVSAGVPPIAQRLPVISGRVGIDLDPPDLNDDDDTRWLLACTWPGTGRFERTAQAIDMGQVDPPPIVRGDALEALPGVLEGRGDGRIVVLNSWSFSYFAVEQRQEYVELLAEVSRHRPIVWVTMDTPGIVEPLVHVTPPIERSEPDLLAGVIFDGGHDPHAEALAFVQSHGQSMAWQAPSGLPAVT